MKESIFEEGFTLEALSAMGNPLEQVSSLIDFELFRPALENVLVKDDCKTAPCVQYLQILPNKQISATTSPLREMIAP